MYRGELAIGHPKFSKDSQAAVSSSESSPVTQEGAVEDIQYTAEDDKAIEQHLRENIGTTWHSLGTCPMKSRDEGGVVDTNLNVYGTTGLKVIDLSIPPKNVGANTQITAYTIAEKGSDLILKELGITSRQVNGLSH
jgi:alcohol oxidase